MTAPMTFHMKNLRAGIPTIPHNGFISVRTNSAIVANVYIIRRKNIVKLNFV